MQLNKKFLAKSIFILVSLNTSIFINTFFKRCIMVPSNLQLKMHISLRLHKIWYSVHWALLVTSEELYKFYMRLWPIIYLWTWTFSYLKCWVVGIQIKWCFEGIASHLSKILLIENGSFSVRHWFDCTWQNVVAQTH